MVNVQNRLRPGWGVCGNDLGTGAGTNFYALGATLQSKRMRHRRGERGKQRQQHRQPYRPGAVQRSLVVACDEHLVKRVVGLLLTVGVDRAMRRGCAMR